MMAFLFNVGQALFAGLVLACFARLLIIPFRWEKATKARVYYRVWIGVGAFMLVYYQWLAPK